MLKRILFIQLMSLILSGCQSFPYTKSEFVSTLNEVQTNKYIRESHEHLSKQLEDNWVQSTHYKNKKMTATFRINLENDGTIKSFKMMDSFCANDLKNECKTFVSNVEKTVLKSFPTKGVTTTTSNCYIRNLEITFRSKEGNELFAKQQKGFVSLPPYEYTN
jgi:PBP1b-binding outer membrane lipoprotein LpoB